MAELASAIEGNRALTNKLESSDKSLNREDNDKMEVCIIYLQEKIA